MENEIERLVLLGKLNELTDQVLKETDKQRPIPSQISQLPSKFRRLKTILEKELNNTTSSTKLTKEKLHELNNLLSQWQSKQSSIFSPEVLVFAPMCAIALEKILEELTQPQPESEPQLEPQSQPEHEHEPEPQSHPETVAEGETRHEAMRWSNQYVDEKGVFGLEDKEVFLRRVILPKPLEEKKDILRDFGLVGMRGIGKTTLAQMVFNHPDIRDYFFPRLWVCASKQPRDDKDPKKEIVKRILRSLGVEDEIINYADEKHQLKGLLYSLRQQLLGKRYLIVLDDVCIDNKEYLTFVSNLEENIQKCKEKLAYGLPKECGGAVIVTSRSEKIVKGLVGEDNLHRVLPLSADDCWKIFKYTYEEEGDLMSKEMESLKKKIEGKCHGLPLGAKLMGEIARKANPTQRQQD